jgi:hypothetical protein
MARAVPRRADRTAQGFRFVTAGLLRLVPAAISAGGTYWCRVADRLESKSVFVRPDWLEFQSWHTATALDDVPAAGLDLTDDPRERVALLVRSFQSRTAGGFERLQAFFHAAIYTYLYDLELYAAERELEFDTRTAALDGAVANVMREVFGGPVCHERHLDRKPVYRWPPRLLPREWLTDTATTLARRIWDTREFGAMPILADALQDAGCDREDVLDHLRDPVAVHSRGCWVLDSILGQN